LANRLADEKSPYLQQHKNNPVDWYPWSDKAFEKAKREDKPVFLSIGYSTCHWCHVMERESFEDEEVAGILNEGYVSIKVDREERPDIDHIYMKVCQAMTGHGGWPLTVIMTPDKKPFFAGTYFPKKGGARMPGLIDILTLVRKMWQEEKDRILAAGERIAGTVQPGIARRTGVELNGQVLDRAFEQLEARFDGKYGGFGVSPKFPAPHNLAFLLRYWKSKGAPGALAMVEKTLEGMYRGGIYDHIGFGFARYSTDEKWLLPHFEKMLYDNALLALVYIEAFQAVGRELYARVAREVLAYVQRDMTAPEGGFYSAEDADSEGEEGKFYVWTPLEVKEVLGQREGEIFCRLYDITPEGNFGGKNIPNLIFNKPEDVAAEFDIKPGVMDEFIEKSRQKLFKHREGRVRPFKDDKILTAWNGLMIAAMAKGAAVFGEPAYREAAARAVDFINKKLVREDGRLLARYREGEAAFPAYLDDYAFLAWGLIELYEATYQVDYLRKAVDLTKRQIDLFWDKENGGFFFYGEDGERLLSRPKELYDGALPSGNSVALVNLLRLFALTGDEMFSEKAAELLSAFAGEVEEYPAGYPHFLTGAGLYLWPAREVVIAGQVKDPGVKRMLNYLQQSFLPETTALFHPEGDGEGDLEKLVPLIKEQRSLDGKATAYICENRSCRAPVTDYDEFVSILRDFS